jgi:biotin operon repressor
MPISHDNAVNSTESRSDISLRGHQPLLFKGQKAAILDLLLKNKGRWVPAYSLSAVALQYGARVKELRDAGYQIENRTERYGRQVHGSFRLIACPGETGERIGATDGDY